MGDKERLMVEVDSMKEEWLAEEYKEEDGEKEESSWEGAATVDGEKKEKERKRLTMTGVG